MMLKALSSRIFAGLGVIATCVLSAACASSGAPSPTPPVDSVVNYDATQEEFSGKKFIWQSASGEVSGETIIAFNIREVEGKAAVCGLHMSRGAVDRFMLQKVLALAQIKSGSQVLMENIAHFREAQPDDDPSALRAACRLSEFDWDPVYAEREPELVIRGEFYDPDAAKRLPQ